MATCNVARSDLAIVMMGHIVIAGSQFQMYRLRAGALDRIEIRNDTVGNIGSCNIGSCNIGSCNIGSYSIESRRIKKTKRYHYIFFLAPCPDNN